MGLLQKASANKPSEIKSEAVSDNKVVKPRSNSIGLMKKSLLFSNSKELDFFELTDKYKINIAAIFSLNNNCYSIKQSVGFDGVSIASSFSTNDFWNGLIKETNKTYTFSQNDNSILPLYQFFSPLLKEQIQKVYIYKTENENIFMFCGDKRFSLPDNLILDVQSYIYKDFLPKQEINIPNNNYCYIYNIDFTKAVTNFITSQNKNDYRKELENIFNNEIFHTLYKNFCSPSNVIEKKLFNFIVFYNICEQPAEQLLFEHLKFSFSYLFENFSNDISITFIEQTNKTSQLKNILQVE